MTITEIQEALRSAITQIALKDYSIELENIAAETPPKTELGDIAFPIAFEMAKLIKQATGVKRIRARSRKS